MFGRSFYIGDFLVVTLAAAVVVVVFFAVVVIVQSPSMSSMNRTQDCLFSSFCFIRLSI